MIALRSLGVVFHAGTPLEKRALGGLSFDIPEGQWVSVIGSNGAGKSTVLNTLAGEIPATEGSIFVDGVDITAWPVWRRSRFAARVFQDPLIGTAANLTLEENLSLALARGPARGLRPALTRQKRALFRDRLRDLDLGLEDRLQDRIGLLSGGQRQAVSLLMATLSPSGILLLDEHTAALDPRMAALIMGLTERLVRQDGLTTLMVTHSLHDALRFGDRTIMMHDGRIVLDVRGEARAALTVESLLEAFSRVRGERVDDDALLMDSV